MFCTLYRTQERESPQQILESVLENLRLHCGNVIDISSAATSRGTHNFTFVIHFSILLQRSALTLFEQDLWVHLCTEKI